MTCQFMGQERRAIVPIAPEQLGQLFYVEALATLTIRCRRVLVQVFPTRYAGVTTFVSQFIQGVHDAQAI